ncbi:hypothetical protein BH10BAC5_BH10BAC5_03420 [soil metagenome]
MKRYLNIFLAVYIIILNVGSLYGQWIPCPGGPFTTVITSFLSYGNTVYAGTNSIGIYATTSHGVTWYPVNNGLGNWGIYSLGKNDSYMFAGTNQGVWRSNDSGNSWENVNFGLSNTSVTCFEKIGNIFTTGTYGGGVYVSTDNGNYWYNSNINLSNLDIKALKTKDTLLFAGTYGGGVFRSTDNGFTWTPKNTGLPDVYISSLATAFNNIFVSIYNRGVFKSTNNGNSWIGANSGLGTFNVLSLSSNFNNLFASTETGGIFVSTNGGTIWTSANSGIDPSHYYINAMGFSDSYAFCAPYGEPAYSRLRSQISGININSQTVKTFKLYYNYPNPFNPETTIKFDILQSSELTLQVYDIKGKLISELLKGMRNPGSYEIRFDGKHLSSGVYYYKLTASSLNSSQTYSQTKAMLLLK